MQKSEQDRSVACPPSSNWETVSLFSPRTKTLTLLVRADILDGKKTETFAFPLVASEDACGAVESVAVAEDGGMERPSGSEAEQD